MPNFTCHPTGRKTSNLTNFAITGGLLYPSLDQSGPNLACETTLTDPQTTLIHQISSGLVNRVALEG